MKKQLQLLTLTIACALLYDGCKSDDPEVITTVTVELLDGKTQQPVPGIRFEILANYSTSNFFYSSYERIDTISTDITGKFTKVFSSKKIGKTYGFAAYIDKSDNKFYLKYLGIQCYENGCYSFDSGETTKLVFYTY
jgi:hypothetical protein